MRRKGWLLFSAISVLWGIPYLFIKIAVRELDPTVVVCARVGIATAVLVPVATQRNMWRQLRGRWFVITVLALVQVVGPFVLIGYGEQHITSSLTSLLIAVEPLLVVLFALRFDSSERMGGLRLIGLLIGLGGVVTLLGLDVGGDEHQLLGGAAGALLVKRPSVAALPSLGAVAAGCAVAKVVLSPLAVTHLPGRLPDLEVLASLLVLGLISTALAWLTFFSLVAEVGASRGTVFTYVNPAISVLLGVTLLDERLTAAIVVGFLLIIVGSWLSTGGALPPPLGHLLQT